jgi:hypothetical protein
MMIAALLMLAGVQEMSLPPEAQSHQKRDRIDKILATRDGKSEATAYKVKSVGDEYKVLARLNLRPGTQALIRRGAKAYDLLTATDPVTGTSKQIWFNISSFYGSGF